MTPDLFSDTARMPETVAFEPTRTAGLARLTQFSSRTGTHYASQRNYDPGPSHRSTVSALSPWIRHRLITEEDVLARTLARHSPTAAMKFIQEVFWRGYFKGWLQQHPSVWRSYQLGLMAAQNRLERDVHAKTDHALAIDGRTGIACFDHWCRELKETGYLHNHARMWFASIWIFTLRLPWELGAQFFLNHLIDGDPASNTLSWRWVGGLHTKGKTYLARPSNIAKYTNGQFDPAGQLAQSAEPLIEETDHPLVPLVPTPQPVQSDHLLLLTSEDCRPETVIAQAPAAALSLLAPPKVDQNVQIHAFKQGALTDAMARLGGAGNLVQADNWVSPIIEAAQQAGVTHVTTPFVPIGPEATKLEATQAALMKAGIQLHQHQRTYDALTWPHAKKGFFKLKKKIPQILAEIGFDTA